MKELLSVYVGTLFRGKSRSPRSWVQWGAIEELLSNFFGMGRLQGFHFGSGFALLLIILICLASGLKHPVQFKQIFNNLITLPNRFFIHSVKAPCYSIEFTYYKDKWESKIISCAGSPDIQYRSSHNLHFQKWGYERKPPSLRKMHSLITSGPHMACTTSKKKTFASAVSFKKHNIYVKYNACMFHEESFECLLTIEKDLALMPVYLRCLYIGIYI